IWAFVTAVRPGADLFCLPQLTIPQRGQAGDSGKTGITPNFAQRNIILQLLAQFCAHPRRIQHQTELLSPQNNVSPMLRSSMDNNRSRIREHAHWVLIMERALAQYGLSLSHSSLAQELTRSPLPASLFIEQANANLIWGEALRLAGDDLF